MFGQSDPSKTEKGTKKQRDKSRNEGNVPRSQELSKATTLLTGLVFLTLFLGNMNASVQNIYRWLLPMSVEFNATPQNVYTLFIDLSAELAVILLPILCTLMVVAYLTQRLQVGKLWTTKVFKPKWGKIFNLAKGLQRLFISPQTLLNMVKQLLQAFFIGLAPYMILKEEFDTFPTLFHQDVAGLAAYILSAAARMVTYALIPILLIAVGDLIYTRWNYEEQLKMTKDEIKDERKQAEGDPKVKQHQRQKMMAAMAQRMMQQVPKADVVITNPTHIAVALQYDPMTAPAPMVLAKGLDHVAEKIKKIARENNVPIRENKPLAQALYKNVEIGDSIPEELFQAVAQILAQLWKYKKR